MQILKKEFDSLLNLNLLKCFMSFKNFKTYQSEFNLLYEKPNNQYKRYGAHIFCHSFYIDSQKIAHKDNGLTILARR